MMRVEFEWNEKKNRRNLAKHGIDFQSASEVFSDPLQITQPDRDHDGEQRWKTVGQVRSLPLILVVNVTFEDRDADGPIEVIRIISARLANKHERKDYEQV